jgi:hypothetical protein
MKWVATGIIALFLSYGAYVGAGKHDLIASTLGGLIAGFDRRWACSDHVVSCSQDPREIAVSCAVDYAVYCINNIGGCHD